MQRLCFSFNIQPGTFDEYKKRHDEIWPELVSELKGAGLSNYSLFRDGETRIIGYVECEPDPVTCFGRLQGAEANTRWTQWFEDIIVPSDGENVQANGLAEVWHLE